MQCVTRFRSAASPFALLVCVFFLAPALWADAFNYFENFNFFGDQGNFACGKKFACGAVSSVNSFIFLENQYKAIYGNKLTPNYDKATNTDMKDAKNFGFDGWKVGANPMRKGYYPRPGSAEGDYIATLQDWFHDYAPGTSVLSSWYAGSTDHNGAPTINSLAGEIRHQEDVELFVKNTAASKTFFHVITLTAISCDAKGNCKIKYQDPNQPKVQQMADLVKGKLQFTGLPGSKYAGTVDITAQFSESPVPEPSSLLLIGTVIAGSAYGLRRKFGMGHPRRGRRGSAERA